MRSTTHSVLRSKMSSEDLGRHGAIRFQPRPVKRPAPTQHGQVLCELLSALMCAEGVTQAELCVRLRCDETTLQRRLDDVGALAYKLGWVIYEREPTLTDRSTRLQLRFNAGMPGATPPEVIQGD